MEAIRMMTYPAHVRVTVTKPLPELGIILRVLVKRLNSVADDFHAHAISEALQQCAKLAEGLLHRSLRAHLLMIVLDCTQVSKAITWGESRLTIQCSSLPMISILLEPAKEPSDALLVVLVVLTLDDDLLEAMRDIFVSAAGVVYS